MNTEKSYGHWSDRFTAEELAKLVEAMPRNARLMLDAARGLRGQLPASEYQQLSDEVAEYSHRIAVQYGAYDDSAILADASDCLDELAKEHDAHLNVLPYFRRIATDHFEPSDTGRELPEETDSDGLPL